MNLRPALPALPMVAESRKLTGLLITLAALLVLLVIAVAAIALFGVDWQLFVSFGGYVSGIGGAQQFAQASADRSPNYPAPPRVPPV